MISGRTGLGEARGLSRELLGGLDGVVVDVLLHRSGSLCRAGRSRRASVLALRGAAFARRLDLRRGIDLRGDELGVVFDPAE